MLPSHSDKKEDPFTPLESMWYFALLSINMGPENNPKSPSGKILMFSWGTFILIVLTTFTANLAAFFSNKGFIKPLESVVDIPKSGYNVSSYSYFKNYFSKWDNVILRNHIKQNKMEFDINITPTSGSLKVDEVRSKLLSGKIWVGMDFQLKSIQQEIPNMYILDGHIMYSGYSLAMRKGWPWAEKMKRKFIQYGKSGLFDIIKDTHISKKLSKVFFFRFNTCYMFGGVQGYSSGVLSIPSFYHHCLH